MSVEEAVIPEAGGAGVFDRAYVRAVVERVRKQLDAAGVTEGPWVRARHNVVRAGPGGEVVVAIVSKQADAELIASMREDLAVLVGAGVEQRPDASGSAAWLRSLASDQASGSAVLPHLARVCERALAEMSPLANAASAAAAKIVHHPRWPRMAAEAHSLATKIIVAEMESALKKAWETPAALRAHVLRYGPPGYDIIDTDPPFDRLNTERQITPAGDSRKQ